MVVVAVAADPDTRKQLRSRVSIPAQIGKQRPKTALCGERKVVKAIGHLWLSPSRVSGLLSARVSLYR